MRKSSFSLFAAYFILLLSFETLNAQSVRKASVQSSSISILNGGWQRVTVKVNGKTENRGQEFRVYNNGFFSIIGQDSAGAWKATHGGTYDISDNLYKEKIQYSSYPDRMGVNHWQEFTLKGDTITFKLFNKVLTPQGNDITANYPKMEMVCVRMKK